MVDRQSGLTMDAASDYNPGAKSPNIFKGKRPTLKRNKMKSGRKSVCFMVDEETDSKESRRQVLDNHGETGETKAGEERQAAGGRNQLKRRLSVNHLDVSGKNAAPQLKKSHSLHPYIHKQNTIDDTSAIVQDSVIEGTDPALRTSIRLDSSPALAQRLRAQLAPVEPLQSKIMHSGENDKSKKSPGLNAGTKAKRHFRADLLHKLRRQSSDCAPAEACHSSICASKAVNELGIGLFLDQQIDYEKSQRLQKTQYKQPKGPKYLNNGVVRRTMIGSQEFYDEHIQLKRKNEEQEMKAAASGAVKDADLVVDKMSFSSVGEGLKSKARQLSFGRRKASQNANKKVITDMQYEKLCADAMLRVQKNKEDGAAAGLVGAEAQERHLKNYEKHLQQWDDHEDKVVDRLKKADIRKYGSARKAAKVEAQRQKELYGTSVSIALDMSTQLQEPGSDYFPESIEKHAHAPNYNKYKILSFAQKMKNMRYSQQYSAR